MSESSCSHGSYFALAVMLLGFLCGAGVTCIAEFSNNDGIVIAGILVLVPFEVVAFVLGWFFSETISGKLAMIGAGAFLFLVLINTALYFLYLWHSPALAALMAYARS